MKTCFLEITMGHFENKSDLKDGDNWSSPLHLGKTYFFLYAMNGWQHSREVKGCNSVGLYLNFSSRESKTTFSLK